MVTHLPDARTSHLRTLSKNPGTGLSAAPHPSKFPPREPHILARIWLSSTPCFGSWLPPFTLPFGLAASRRSEPPILARIRLSSTPCFGVGCRRSPFRLGLAASRRSEPPIL